MVALVRTPRDPTPMYTPACYWSKFKWLVLALPLALSGCEDPDTDAARELRTRLDEAQVRIEAQATQIARLERTLSAAGKAAARQADLRQQTLRSAQAARTQQLNTLQQQRRALLLDQRNLRQALAMSTVTTRNFNQQLLFAAQQIRYLRERVNTLDAWLRQQANLALAQSRELATLREARNQTENQNK